MITCANKREGMRNEVIPHEVYGIFDIFLVYQVEPNVTDPIVGITKELSNRISYYVCTFDDVSYVVCCVVVATPPVQVP